jgi:hypothetical protein
MLGGTFILIKNNLNTHPAANQRQITDFLGNTQPSKGGRHEFDR